MTFNVRRSRDRKMCGKYRCIADGREVHQVVYVDCRRKIIRKYVEPVRFDPVTNSVPQETLYPKRVRLVRK